AAPRLALDVDESAFAAPHAARHAERSRELVAARAVHREPVHLADDTSRGRDVHEAGCETFADAQLHLVPLRAPALERALDRGAIDLAAGRGFEEERL